ASPVTYTLSLLDALPIFILAGIRLSVGRAVKGMINGEMFIALIGLGGLAAKYGDESNFPSVWAMAVFIMVIAVILNEFVNWGERSEEHTSELQSRENLVY